MLSLNGLQLFISYDPLRKFKELVHGGMLEKLLASWVLQDLVRHELLKNLPMVYLFFNGVIDHEAIDRHISFLSNAQSAVSRLKVHHGVPVWVKDYYLVRCCQIYAKATYSCGK